MSDLSSERVANTVAGRAEFLVQRIKPLLGGHGSVVQGAVVADLAAIWITSHTVDGPASEQHQLREDLLELHIKLVRELVAVYDTKREG